MDKKSGSNDLDRSALVIGCTAPRRSRGFKRTHWKVEHGQELVEFALSFTILALFIFGVLDLGRIFHALIVLHNAAREGARFGSEYVLDVSPGALTCTGVVQDIIRAKARAEAASSGIDISASPIDVICPGARGLPLRVNVTYQFQFFISGFFPASSLTLNRYAEMMVP